jgi:hypothetical protein
MAMKQGFVLDRPRERRHEARVIFCPSALTQQDSNGRTGARALLSLYNLQQEA